jgi:hypothetical protein
MWPLSSLLLLLLLGTSPLAVGMHKCVDADGNVTYSQTACEEPTGSPPRETAARSSVPEVVAGTAVGDVLCDRVHDFALELAEAMRDGVGLDRAVAILGGRADPAGFDSNYGGRVGSGTVTILGDDALEIINHVFAFAGRGAVEPARIAESAVSQCRRGRFDFERGAAGGAAGLRRRAGSGILLNAQGMVLTADRLIAECGRLRVYRGGTWHDARLLRRAPASGLVVLLADGVQGRPAVFTDADAPASGRLNAASLPLRGVLTGSVTVADAIVGRDRPASHVQASDGFLADAGLAVTAGAGILPLLDLPPGPAWVGAPLLDDAGLVGGIVLPGAAEGMEPVFKPAPALRRFLRADAIAHFSAAGLGQLTRAEVRRRAAGFTVHVECMP